MYLWRRPAFPCLPPLLHYSTTPLLHAYPPLPRLPFETAKPHRNALMSSRQERQRPPQQRSHIAKIAARLMAEDGIASAALAKRKAARSLGLPDNAAMPDDAPIALICVSLATAPRLVDC